MIEPGIYDDLPEEEYHASPGISKHGLDLIAKSPAHYRYDQDHPEEREKTPAMLFGSMVDDGLLSPHRFERYVVKPDVDRRTKAGKAAYAEWQATLDPDTEIVSQELMGACSRVIRAVGDHPIASILLDGVTQRSIFWNDPETGVLCRARLDVDNLAHNLLIDLKTAASAAPAAFGSAAAKWRYHVQAAWYLWGMEQLGEKRDAFVFVVVEKEPPFAICEYILGEEELQLGQDLWRRDLMRYAECLNADRWPGYPQEIQALTLPGWAFYGD